MTRRELAATPFNPRAPFARASALRAGLTDQDLRSARFRQIFWGTYIDSSVPDTLGIRAMAALMLSPAGSTLSHHTAAELWGGVTPPDPDLHVSVVRQSGPQVAGIRVHRRRTAPLSQPWHAWFLATPERTFIDLAADLSLIDSVVLGDSLVHAGRTTPQSLVAAAEAHRGRCHRRALDAARLVRSGAESPMETRVRLTLVLAGLPEPVLQFEVTDAHGRPRYRLDVAYEEEKVGVEYDGRHHIDRESQWSYDLGRREDLETEGWRLVVITAKDYFRDPAAIVSRTSSALRERGMRGLPRDLGRIWHRHHPAA